MRPTIPGNAREAKDFLANQTARQAVLNAIPLSELEKRMMYFSESDPTGENPVALNGDFAGQYSSEEYERKIARLLKHAYNRIKKGNSDQKEI